MVRVIMANKFDNNKRNTRKFNVAGNSHMYLILMLFLRRSAVRVSACRFARQSFLAGWKCVPEMQERLKQHPVKIDAV
jgi:hypothetical protein